jgi:hypothetical protein
LNEAPPWDRRLPSEKQDGQGVVGHQRLLIARDELDGDVSFMVAQLDAEAVIGRGWLPIAAPAKVGPWLNVFGAVIQLEDSSP